MVVFLGDEKSPSSPSLPLPWPSLVGNFWSLLYFFSMASGYARYGFRSEPTPYATRFRQSSVTAYSQLHQSIGVDILSCLYSYVSTLHSSNYHASAVPQRTFSWMRSTLIVCTSNVFQESTRILMYLFVLAFPFRSPGLKLESPWTSE